MAMTLPLRPDQESHLVALCKEMGRTPEDFVREAVLTFMEDYEDGMEAEAAVLEAKAEGKFYTSEEVRKELGLEGYVHAESSQAA